MAQFGKEGRELIRKLYDLVDLDQIESKNTKKQIRRTLGALIFSSDSAGYLDIVEDGLSKNLSAKKIFGQLRSKSEKLIEAYSPVTGVYEAHHANPLSALRDAYLALPPDEQDIFMDRIEKSGWKLGDDPEQLTKTVFSRPSHQNLKPEMKKGDPSGMKGLFQGIEMPQKEFTAHARGTRDPLLQVKPGVFTTGDALADHFEQVLAPRAMEDAGNAMVQDTAGRAAAAQAGLDLYDVSPEANVARPEAVTRAGTEAFAEGYSPVDKGARQILQEVGEDPAELLTRPTAIEDMSKLITVNLTGLTEDSLKKLARRTLLAAGGAIPVVGFGAQAAEVQKAEESGDSQRQMLEAGQLGLEFASQAVPVADAVNIATDIGQTYTDLRSAGASNMDIAKGVVDLGVKAVQNPGKVVDVVKESFADIPEQVSSGFNYLANKIRETRMSLNGYSAF